MKNTLTIFLVLLSMPLSGFSQNITDSQKSSLLSLPQAHVSMDTFFAHDTIHIDNIFDGIIFAEYYNNNVYTYTKFIEDGTPCITICDYYRTGLSYGNFVPVLNDKNLVTYTALHIVDGLSSLPIATNWNATFGRDDIASSSQPSHGDIEQSYKYSRSLCDTISSLDSVDVVICGWKVFRDGLVRVAIDGKAFKLFDFTKAAAPPSYMMHDTYMIRIPDDMVWLLSGLSGSGVYLKSDMTQLVALQSQETFYELSTHGQKSVCVIAIIEKL